MKNLATKAGQASEALSDELTDLLRKHPVLVFKKALLDWHAAAIVFGVNSPTAKKHFHVLDALRAPAVPAQSVPKEWRDAVEVLLRHPQLADRGKIEALLATPTPQAAVPCAGCGQPRECGILGCSQAAPAEPVAWRSKGDSGRYFYGDMSPWLADGHESSVEPLYLAAQPAPAAGGEQP